MFFITEKALFLKAVYPSVYLQFIDVAGYTEKVIVSRPVPFCGR